MLGHSKIWEMFLKSFGRFRLCPIVSLEKGSSKVFGRLVGNVGKELFPKINTWF
jgi:hypothetical protein